jgi:hypothetical protein
LKGEGNKDSEREVSWSADVYQYSTTDKISMLCLLFHSANCCFISIISIYSSEFSFAARISILTNKRPNLSAQKISHQQISKASHVFSSRAVSTWRTSQMLFYFKNQVRPSIAAD